LRGLLSDLFIGLIRFVMKLDYLVELMLLSNVGLIEYEDGLIELIGLIDGLIGNLIDSVDWLFNSFWLFVRLAFVG